MGGSATIIASHRLATSIVPWTHQRRGTLSRSSYSTGVKGMVRPCPTAVPDPVPAPEVAVLRLDPDLPLPSYAHPGDAGADLVTAEDVVLQPGERALVPTGVALALPEGHVALVHPRSGLAARHGLSIVNTPGTIDSGYRGEIKVLLINHDPGAADQAAARGPDRAARGPALRARPLRRGRPNSPNPLVEPGATVLLEDSPLARPRAEEKQ